MVDAYSKFVLLVALPNKSSLTIASAVREQLIGVFGIPLTLRTDNGSEFSGALAEVCSVLDSKCITTSPYHSPGNG